MTATPPLEAGGPLARLDRAAWDVRALPNRSDVRVLLDSHADLLAQLEFAVKLLRPFGHSAQVQAMDAAIARARSERQP